MAHVGVQGSRDVRAEVSTVGMSVQNGEVMRGRYGYDYDYVYEYGELRSRYGYYEYEGYEGRGRYQWYRIVSLGCDVECSLITKVNNKGYLAVLERFPLH